RLAELTVEAAERASRDLGWARPAAWWGKPLSDTHRRPHAVPRRGPPFSRTGLSPVRVPRRSRHARNQGCAERNTVMTSEAVRTEAAIPYRGPLLPNTLDDLVELGALDADCDERLWVPQAPDVTFRPLLLCPSQGYFVNILRVRRS